MKKLISRNKSIALLLFLFGYSNLFAYGGSSSCSGREGYGHQIDTALRTEICNQKSRTIAERLSDKHSFLYLKIPELGNEYLEYGNEESERNLEPDKRKERTLPIHIEVGDTLLNPRKDDYLHYKASSKIKERIISENYTIKRRNCTFMALGSEYLFPVSSGIGTLSVILYFNYTHDMIGYQDYKRYAARSSFTTFPIGENNKPSIPQENYYSQFIHRSLRTEINFKPDGVYQLEITINPNSAIARKSYSAFHAPFQKINAETVPGFTITLKELPANTKFAFDGKDDIGKTYEQVKKEFILYDKSAEGN
jgi:hypothetical protein